MLSYILISNGGSRNMIRMKRRKNSVNRIFVFIQMALNTIIDSYLLSLARVLGV